MFHKKLTKKVDSIEETLKEFIRQTSLYPEAVGAVLHDRFASGLVRKHELEAIIGDRVGFKCTWVGSQEELESPCPLSEREKTLFDYIRELEERDNDLELKIVHLERIITQHISGTKKKKKVSKSGRK